MINRLCAAILIALVIMTFATACSSGTPASTTAPVATSSTSQDGASLVAERCSRCHPLTRIESAQHTAAEWKAIVDMMISRGAQLTSSEETAVVDYLAANFGK